MRCSALGGQPYQRACEPVSNRINPSKNKAINPHDQLTQPNEEEFESGQDGAAIINGNQTIQGKTTATVKTPKKNSNKPLNTISVPDEDAEESANSRTTQSLNGIGGLNAVTGGSYPAGIWKLFMKAALAKLPIVDFPAPSNIGGTEPVDMTQAVPTLDPALAEKPTPVAKAYKPTPTPKVSKKK